jgi:pimeloyl-ACP methyl ester carboxylesterase
MTQETYHPFKSQKDKGEYLAFYDKRASAWAMPFETRMIETFFGQTFVRINGPSDAPPLIFLPGSVLNSLMWLPNIGELSKKFRTYAVDNIYDSGRSIYNHAPKTPNDFMLWLDELFTKLDLNSGINLAGLSYGAWLAGLYALHAPNRIGKIVLMGHPAITPAKPGFILRFLSAFFSPKNFEKFASWLFEDAIKKGGSQKVFADEMILDMQLTARCYKPFSTVVPKLLKDKELQSLVVPALFLIGENEKTFSVQKAVQRLNKIAPQIKTEVIPQAGHDLTFAQPEIVVQNIIEFIQPT